MAVIPDTTKVIVWDSRSANQGTSAGQPWPQRFAVGDPVTGVFDNYVVPVPVGWGAGGGLTRSSDYEVYSPPYLNSVLPRPDFAGTWSRSSPGHVDVMFGQTYVIDHAPLPVGTTVSRVVLMRPCSTTHQSDMDQRYVELETVVFKPPQYSQPNTITVRAPAGPTGASMEAPPGFYMAFLISSQGLPSQAKWVELQ